MSKSITGLTTAINSLVASAISSSELTDESKIETYQLAKEIRAFAKDAKSEIAQLSADERDAVAFKVGLEFIKILGA